MTEFTEACRYRPEGVLDIARATELRAQLLDLLARGEEVCLDLSRVTAVDLAFFQVVCAAHRSAARRGVRLRLEAAGAELFVALRDAGVTGHSTCHASDDDACLWQA